MRLIIAVFLLFFNNVVLGGSSMRDYFYISIEASGLHASVEINGFEAIAHDEGFSLVSSSPIDYWLSNEANSIVVDIEPLTNGEKISGDLSIEIFKHDPKYDVPTPGVSYWKFDLSNEPDVIGKVPVFKKTSELLIKHTLGSQLWSDAEVVKNVSTSDKKEILSLIQTLETAILSKNTKLIINSFEYKIAEDARINKKTLSAAKELAENEFSGMFSGGDFEIPRKFSTEIMHLKKSADSKILSVVDLDRKSALQFVIDDEYEISIDIYVSKINGEWKIVR